MSDITLFENNALANSDLFKELQDVNSNLLSGSGGGQENRRISLAGSKFREIVNGDEVSASKEDNMNVVILNAAKISRTYYQGTYNPAALAWMFGNEKSLLLKSESCKRAQTVGN